MSGQLYLVATPIGNLGDITLRALETLKSVDIIACEDTRHTLKLLNKFEIKKPLISYYKQKENEGTEKIISLLDDEKNIALVTDAGMPCISDPGSALVANLMERGYSYTVVPGACALVSAVSLCGVSGSFSFLGFLPEKVKDKRELLAKYENIPSALVFYCAPHNINDDLDFLYKTLGDRTVYVIKEITKIYESVIKGRLSNLRVEAKGEYVVIVEKGEEIITSITDEDIKEALKKALSDGMDGKTAVKMVTEDSKTQKNRVYDIMLRIKNEK